MKIATNVEIIKRKGGSLISIINGESKAEIDIVLVHKILHVLHRQHLAAPGEVHIAIAVNVACLGIGPLHPTGLPLIDHRAEVAEAVEIAGRSHHRIDSLRHFRGQILGIGAVLAVRQMAAELGGVLHLDF